MTAAVQSRPMSDRVTPEKLSRQNRLRLELIEILLPGLAHRRPDEQTCLVFSLPQALSLETRIGKLVLVEHALLRSMTMPSEPDYGRPSRFAFLLSWTPGTIEARLDFPVPHSSNFLSRWRALCNCDLEVPIDQPVSSAISGWE